MPPIPTARRLVSRDLHAIRVENIPLNVNRREVIALFNTLVGDVRGSSDVMAACGGHLEIYFYSKDAAKKALCMSGYTIAGTALIVTYANSSYESKELHHTKPGDTRRNLYVLGLPFDLNKQEFAAVFSQYGTVEHCVILATVDNASRRRGFVVMASHADAKRAMIALTQDTPLTSRGQSCSARKARTLYAPTFIAAILKQCKTGFLDGGDRGVFRDEHTAQDSPAPATDAAEYIDSPPKDDAVPSFVPSSVPSTAILVSNLPQALFSEIQDLNPLLCPFGELKKIEIVSRSENSISVLTDYACLESAVEAKRTLEGQNYLDSVLAIQYAVYPQALEMENPSAVDNDRFELYGYRSGLPLGGDEAGKFANAYTGYHEAHGLGATTLQSRPYALPFDAQRMYFPPTLSRSSSMSSTGSMSSRYGWSTPGEGRIVPFSLNDSTNVYDASSLQIPAYL